jgi:hypothetical protein
MQVSVSLFFGASASARIVFAERGSIIAPVMSKITGSIAAFFIEPPMISLIRLTFNYNEWLGIIQGYVNIKNSL